MYNVDMIYFYSKYVIHSAKYTLSKIILETDIPK